MKLSFPSPEFDDAVAALCHGSATEAEMRALSELLRSDSSARDEYLLRIEVHARLASEPELFSPAPDAAAGCRLPGIGPGSGNFQILASPPVLTLDKFGTWLHLAVVLDGKAGRGVHYVNGFPVSRHSLRIDPPFRLDSAELGDWNARSGPDPAPFLIRNLGGSLDEFELFSRALSDAEIRELFLWQGQT